MSTRSRVLSLVFCTLAAMLPLSAEMARGQQASDGLQSTMTGVYTASQAMRGEETYMAICVSCHPAGTYKTVNFKASWKDRLLSELYEQVSQKMPKNDPASLSANEYAQVVAYLLKINDVPPGETELPPDNDVLKKIRIEMPAVDRHD